MSSADWMPRNLDRRIELLFPIEDRENKMRIINLLEIYLKDTEKTRLMKSDGSYIRVDKRGKETLNAQEYFYDYIKEKVKAINHPEVIEFKPRSSYE